MCMCAFFVCVCGSINPYVHKLLPILSVVETSYLSCCRTVNHRNGVAETTHPSLNCLLQDLRWFLSIDIGFASYNNSTATEELRDVHGCLGRTFHYSVFLFPLGLLDKDHWNYNVKNISKRYQNAYGSYLHSQW